MIRRFLLMLALLLTGAWVFVLLFHLALGVGFLTFWLLGLTWNAVAYRFDAHGDR
jgi:hypothetical protein